MSHEFYCIILLGLVTSIKAVIYHNLTFIPTTYQKSPQGKEMFPYNYLLQRVKRQEFDADVPEEPPAPCDFGVGAANLDMCTWLIPVNATSRNRWRLGMGELSAWIGGPRTDHTTSDKQGGYVFFETSYQEDVHQPIIPGAEFTSTTSIQTLDTVDKIVDDPGTVDTAWFISRNLSRTGPMGYCLSFFYMLDGLSVDKLIIHLRDMETSENASLWVTRGEMDSSWIKGELAYTYDGFHLIIFEAVSKPLNDPARPFRGFVALDDITFQQMGSPDLDNCFGHCTFEGGFCGWTNDVEDDFDWELGRASRSFLTGPPRDFSSHNRDETSGGYAYMDASFPRRPGDKARLMSSNFLATGDNNPICMGFATHMFGNGIGMLRVMKRVPGETAPDRILWEISGESGNKWYQAQVSVSSATSYQLIFEATVGMNSLGNIAIDNVAFTPGTCSISPQSASRNSGDCNFEEDSCGWTNVLPIDALDDFDWARQYSYSFSGPPTDRTKGTKEGYYMMLLSNSQNPQRGGTRAWLVSPLFSGTQRTRCLAFYYYMYERSIDPAGPSLGSLRVHIKSASGESRHKLTTLWRLYNHQGQMWQPARTPIVMGLERSFPTAPYQIIFEGIWGDGRVGVVAVDDISFFDGDCSTHPLKAAAVDGECNFDRNMCSWVNKTVPAVPLQKLRGPVYNNGVIPSAAERQKQTQQQQQQFLTNTEGLSWRLATLISRPAQLPDHTFRAQTGYVFFDIFNHVVSQNPVLRSPEFVASQNDARCLSFWFAPFGRGEATALSVFRVSPPPAAKEEDAEPQDLDKPQQELQQRTLIWKMTTRKFDTARPEWTYAQVSIETLTNHWVEFEGGATDGGFALDDVTFYDGNCQSRPERAAVEKPAEEE